MLSTADRRAGGATPIAEDASQAAVVVEAMADKFIELAAAKGGVTADDLKLYFTPGEIAEHGETAVARANRRSQRRADSIPPDIASLPDEAQAPGVPVPRRPRTYLADIYGG